MSFWLERVPLIVGSLLRGLSHLDGSGDGFKIEVEEEEEDIGCGECKGEAARCWEGLLGGGAFVADSSFVNRQTRLPIGFFVFFGFVFGA